MTAANHAGRIKVKHQTSKKGKSAVEMRLSTLVVISFIFVYDSSASQPIAGELIKSFDNLFESGGPFNSPLQFADPSPNLPNQFLSLNPGPERHTIPFPQQQSPHQGEPLKSLTDTPLQPWANPLAPRQLLPQVSNPIVGVVAQSLSLIPNQPFGVQPLPGQTPLGNPFGPG